MRRAADRARRPNLRARLREQRRRRVVRAAARARPLGRNINIKQRVASGVRRGHTRVPRLRRGGFQSNLAPERRARERWVAVPERGADKGGSLITIRAVGYALNDFDDPHNTTLAFDVRDVDDALPPGPAALLGGAPSGGPGSRGRGGAARGGVSPTAATFGARPRGTFFPGPGLRCRFECPVLVTLGDTNTDASHAITDEALVDEELVAFSKNVHGTFLDFGRRRVRRAAVSADSAPGGGSRGAPRERDRDRLARVPRRALQATTA